MTPICKQITWTEYLVKCNCSALLKNHDATAVRATQYKKFKCECPGLPKIIVHRFKEELVIWSIKNILEIC
jgi:hypothetical protein